jgi:elongation factor Tu
VFVLSCGYWRDEIVLPGDHTPLEVGLDKPVTLEAGSRFAIGEGGKTVGSGVMTEVIT